jgi:DNA polymerase III subunit epsilon
MLTSKLAFVDIETTGLKSSYHRIIEIGIVIVEKNHIIKTYESLINPQTDVPREIGMITGITASDLETAPTFRQIKEEILETITDCIFVAHNVQFDYGFLTHEFKRENVLFDPPYLCTVQLSRLLYPQYRHHNLDALIERHNLTCKKRHRALDDATAIFHLYKKIQSETSREKLQNVLAVCLRNTLAKNKKEYKKEY